MKLNLRPNAHPGCLISFCGLDGCGKTTQISLLKEFLENQGIMPVLTKQPTESVRQTDIFRTYMDNPNHTMYDYRALSLLCASDRLQHTNKEIVPRLQQGDTIISDRYFYSCIANLHARGYTEDRWIYEIAEHIIKPDIAFFLDTEVETAVARVRSRESEKNKYIDMDLQYRLREKYMEIAADNGGIVIGAGLSVEEAAQVVQSAVIGKIMCGAKGG